MEIKKITKEEYQEYASNNKLFSQYQDARFTEAYTDNDTFLGVYNPKLCGVIYGWKRLVAGLTKIPFIGSYEFIVRRSEVLNIQESEFSQFTKAINKFMKSEKIYLFSFSPSTPTTINDDEYNTTDFTNLKDCGWEHNLIEDFNKSRAPYFEQAVDLRYDSIELVQKTFKKDSMRKVRKAIKVGTSVEKITASELEQYFELFTETGNRDDFSIKNMDFYYNLANGFEDDATIYISKLDLVKYKQHVEINQPNKTEILEAIDSVDADSITLGLAICIDSDVQMYYHSGATSNMFRETMHNYLLHYTAIDDAFNRGVDFYNFGAIHGSKDKDKPNYSLYQFKSRFAPVTIEMQGEFVLFANSMAKRIYDLKH